MQEYLQKKKQLKINRKERREWLGRGQEFNGKREVRDDESEYPRVSGSLK